MPDNISLLNIPLYSPELNPCDQVWQYIKKRFKNKTFETMKELKQWLWSTSENITEELVKSITANHKYSKIINDIL